MPTTAMTEDRDFSSGASTETPEEPDFGGPQIIFMDPLDALAPAGSLGTRDQIEKELDLIAAAVRVFYRKQPDQVMRECAGFSARLSEMAMLLHRVEAGNRHYTRVRTQQVERFLAEIDRQWKTASRLIEVLRQDIELSR